MNDDKVYGPTEVQPTPFPEQNAVAFTDTQSKVSDIFNQRESQPQAFPPRRIARELLSSALNTKSKAILQQFDLFQQGGFRAGKYVPGVSGEVAVTPNGIVAVNKEGNTTIAIDGETGDAVLSGTVLAKDFVIADENGLVSASVFQSASYKDNTTITLTGTNAFTAVSGSDLPLELVRPAKVLITFFANVTMYATDTLRSYHIDVGAAIDGSIQNQDYARFEVNRMNSDLGTCLSFAKTYLLSAGQHIISMKWATFSDVAGTNELKSRGLDFCMLGS